MMNITLTESLIDHEYEQTNLLHQCCGQFGAMNSFMGIARNRNAKGSVEKIYIEHYEGMTQKILENIAQKAYDTFSIRYCRIVHRYGCIKAGEGIVFVGCIAVHRKPTLLAVSFIMDHLKTSAPFWKKEIGSFGQEWVEARQTDYDEQKKW